MGSDGLRLKNADEARDALRPKIRKALTRMWEHEEGARSFADPEGVHQMRVSSRKVRAALDTSGALFEGKKYRRVSKGVRRLTRALGGVRDGDVLLADLAARRNADGETHPGIDRVVVRLERERERSRDRLLTVLDELDATGFRETSLDAFEGGKKTGRAAKVRRGHARRLIDEHVSAFLAQTESIPAAGEIEALHQIRITAKRLRYSLKIVRKPLMPEAKAVIASLTGVQDQLGEIHNLDVQIGLIRKEMHLMADESLERAMAGGDASVDTNVAPVWDDLMWLTSGVATERRERYARFIAWWDALQASGFRDDLVALTKPRGA